jgi:hypothetical protein
LQWRNHGFLLLQEVMAPVVWGGLAASIALGRIVIIVDSFSRYGVLPHWSIRGRRLGAGLACMLWWSLTLSFAVGYPASTALAVYGLNGFANAWVYARLTLHEQRMYVGSAVAGDS